MSLGLLVVLGAVLGLSVRPQRAYANVTLISFTAAPSTVPPSVAINWETATEIETAGFYVQRSLNVTGSYTQVSPYQVAKGDSVTGATYSWVDETAALNTTYYYRLEEISTSQTSQTYDNNIVSATLRLASASLTPTATPTRTPTATGSGSTAVAPSSTPIPTATPKAAASANVAATSTRPSALLEGATITPRPTSSGVLPNPAGSVSTPDPAVPQAQPLPDLSSTTTAQGAQPAPAAPAANPPAQPTPQNEVYTAQGPMPTQALPDSVQPVVVVTEPAAATGQTSTSRGGPVLLILGATVLLMAGAYLILRQARK